ncbi:MAG TPA: AAA family ATPase [Myxococcaceae bacterium]|nr:AAA family ATPase [Myxococcaceae bacterium]
MDAGTDLDFPRSDRFTVLRRLGAGGMGVVFEAYDRERSAPVALKTFRRMDPERIYALKREFRALADLRHPNLISLGELRCEGGRWYFTMELIHGEDFLHHVWGTHSGAPFDPDRLRRALGGLARGLAVLHARGTIHRDVKPSNVMVDRDGRVVLLDFGLASDLHALAARDEHAGAGTPQYMAPEVRSGAAPGPASDWYAVGAMLHAALTGQPPSGPVTPPPSVPGEEPVLRALWTLCVDLLRAEPSARPGADEVLERLGEGQLPSAAHAPFVGRVAELAALDQAADRAARGEPALVVVEGASGMGKSALVRRFAERLQQRAPSALVLSGRCYEQESVPHKAFDGVVDALSRHLLALPAPACAALLPADAEPLVRLFPVLARVPSLAGLSDGPPAPPAEIRRRAYDAFRQLLAALCRRGPLLIALDDLQWTDADSLDLLRALLQPPGAPPILVIATRRPSPGGALPLQGATRIDLPALPDGDARALVEAAGAADAEAVVRESGGHPLYLQLLARRARAGPEPARLDEVVLEAVAALPAPARRLLEVLSVAAGPLPQQVAADAAGLSAAELPHRLAALASGHLASAGASGAVEPYHDRVKEAVSAHLDAEARRALHEALAKALEASAVAESDPRQLVVHLEATGQTGRAAELAERAARRAEAQLAFDLAVELYRRALALGGQDAARRTILQLAVAQVLGYAGRGAEAAEVFLAVGQTAEPALALEARRRAAEQLLGSGHLERGLKLLAGVLEELGVTAPPTPGRAIASLFWQRARLTLRGFTWKERPAEAVPPRALLEIDTLRSVGMSLWPVDQFRGVSFVTRSQRLALDAGERSRVAMAFALEGIYWAQLGNPRRYRARAEEARRAAAPLGDPQLDALLLAFDGISSYCVGAFEASDQKLLETERRRDPTRISAWELNIFRLMRTWALRDRGAYGALAAVLDAQLKEAVARGDRYAETNLARVCNQVWLARDLPEEAELALDASRWTPPEGGYHFQHWFELFARMNVALYRGEPDLLRRFGKRLREVPLPMFQAMQIARTRTVAQGGRLALADGARATGSARRAAASAAMRAARRVERERTGYGDAWAAMLRAGAAHLRGEREAAAVRLRDALARAEALGMTHYAAAARMRLGAVLGGEEGRALLAGAERWAATEGVRNPPRMFAVLAPGYEAP